MLAIQTYQFLVGTKIPFSDCPGIVQAFLKQQNLHYNRFLYYFQDNFGGLPKIMKDCPNIGPVRSYPLMVGELFYLSNIEEDTGCTEAEILSVVPKIHRKYRINEAHIIYQDINFFAQQIPAVICAPGNTPSCINGSSITLYRDAGSPRWNSIDLKIVIHNGNETYDPTPYFEVMKQLLPGVRHMDYVRYCLTTEEQAIYDNLKQSATPLIERASNYFKRTLPDSSPANAVALDTPKLSVAPVLKRLSKQHEYSYIKYEHGFYFVQKRTANGHYILLEFEVGLRFKGVNLSIRYMGAGFDLPIVSTFQTPQNQKELEDYLLQIFQALSCAEKDVIPALDSHYPPTPEWYTHIA